MNISKLIGMCIVFALVATAASAYTVDEIALNNLLSSYSTSFDDGTFTVAATGLKCYLNCSDAFLTGCSYFDKTGLEMFNLSIDGTGTASPYKVVTRVARISNTAGETQRIVSQTVNGTKASPGIFSAVFDGTKYMNDTEGLINRFGLEVSIYSNELLAYRNVLDFSTTNPYLCAIQDATAAPMMVTFIHQPSPVSKPVIGMDTDADTLYNQVNLSLRMHFYEPRAYTIGVTIRDNASNTAYTETTITTSTIPDNRNVVFVFDADLLRNMNLTNTRLYLQGITVDAIPLKSTGGIPQHVAAALSQVFNHANFDFDEVTIARQTFNISKQANGKITELGVLINLTSAPGTYDVQTTLENDAGDVVVQKTQTISGTETIWFNGTEIYNSKVSGPYRLGTITLLQSGTEKLRTNGIGESQSLSYTNFSNPPRAELEITDANVVTDGSIINATIYNLGPGDATGVVITLFNASAQKTKEVIIDTIPAGSSHREAFTSALSSAFVTVDFNNAIEETNESNNVAVLSVSGPVNNPPTISAVQNSSITNQSATITWTTNEVANATVLYGTAATVLSTRVSSAAFVTSQILALTGLNSNTAYYYNVTSCDAQSNCSTTGPFTFTTLSSPAANVPPVITSTPATTATRGTVYSYLMTATDADALTYGTNDSRFAQASNLFTWTPSSNDFGVVAVTFNVTDGTYVVNQTALITVLETTFNLRAATFDYNTQTFIDSNIQINAQNKNSTGGVPVNFSVASNTAYNIVNSAAGHQPDTDYVYFDSRLTSCIAGQNCNLAGTYTTACTWESTYNNWYCSVVGGTLPKMTWFRYEQTPMHTLKRVNYLLPN